MINIHVQNAVHGTDSCLVRLPPQASLGHLKAVIRDKIGLALGCTAHPYVSLILGGLLLRDEFNINELRWKSLAEYGIQEGAMLGMVQLASLCGPINLVVRLLDADGGFVDGEYLPIEIDAGANLADLKVLICETEGLTPDDWKLSVSLHGELLGTENLADLKETSLAEHGLEEGMTLGLRLWYRERPFKDLSNLVNSSVQQRREYRKFRSRTCRTPALRHSVDFEQSPASTPQHAVSPCSRMDLDKAWDDVQTPTKLRLAIEQVRTPCKTKRSKQSKVSSSLKRL
eukprot:TRINITY_DN31885_c0_g1_i2.p1 TRINITY_DN31885_c0_g1~~TRINITY_DN31885_c0_g1_i2.p1  ORF type:complete len:286 (+),score=46.56 TRINITY_DN31885_c0_g1_i2:170-1027(+)